MRGSGRRDAGGLQRAARGAAVAPVDEDARLWDDFRGGFSVGTPDAKWFYFASGSYVGDDGIAAPAGDGGLTVRARGTNPTTGGPAFTRTLGQEGAADNPDALPGGLDHVKWLVYMNHLASSGVPGFDAVAGRELAFQTRLSGGSFGTAGHPFGAAVSDPGDDPRLAAAAMAAIDFDTCMVFDLFLTNRRIYAVYERLPFARGRYGNYAAFSYLIPVATRTPDAWHAVRIAYDKAAGTVRWLVDHREVFCVTRIGRRLDRQYLTLDHGGIETDVSPDQLDGGLGLFTLLDGYRPSSTALVRLSEADGFYDNVGTGHVAAPGTGYFRDEQSAPGSRLFGQGAELRAQACAVSGSRPASSRRPHRAPRPAARRRARTSTPTGTDA
jgi:Family of unknown function (DUF6081)